MASPYITGVVALLKSIDRKLGPRQIKRLLQLTASPISMAGVFPSVAKQGAGHVNASKAVSFLLEKIDFNAVPAVISPKIFENGCVKASKSSINYPFVDDETWKIKHQAFDSISLVTNAEGTVETFQTFSRIFPNRGQSTIRVVAATQPSGPLLFSGSGTLRFTDYSYPYQQI
jgi:hypothetical protein